MDPSAEGYGDGEYYQGGEGSNTDAAAVTTGGEEEANSYYEGYTEQPPPEPTGQVEWNQPQEAGGQYTGGQQHEEVPPEEEEEEQEEEEEGAGAPGPGEETVINVVMSLPGQGGQGGDSGQQNIQVSFSVRSPSIKNMSSSPKRSPTNKDSTKLNVSINAITPPSSSSSSPKKPRSPKSSSPAVVEPEPVSFTPPPAAGDGQPTFDSMTANPLSAFTNSSTDAGEGAQDYSQQQQQQGQEAGEYNYTESAPLPMADNEGPTDIQAGYEEATSYEGTAGSMDAQEEPSNSYYQQEGEADAGGGDGVEEYSQEVEAPYDYQQQEEAWSVDPAPPIDQEVDRVEPLTRQGTWRLKAPLQIQTEWGSTDTRKVHIAPPDGGATGAGYDHSQDVYQDYCGWTVMPGDANAIPQLEEEERDSDDEEEEENLGDDFEDTQWLPPSEEKALRHMTRKIYLEGKAPICQKADFTDMGIGMRLYFSFLRTLIVLYIILVILNLPALYLYSHGQRIAEEYRDLLGFYAYTLGNMGIATGDGTYKATEGGITLEYAAGVIAAMDVLSCLVFLCGVGYLAYRLRATRTKSKNITVKDFAVYVKGFPQNVGKKEIIDHFNNLYPLNGPDWKQRLPPYGREKHPVLDVTNTNDEKYLATWIAEVTMARHNGEKLRTLLSNDEKTRKLKRIRAHMKMYAENTPLRNGKGADDVMYAFYEKKLVTLGGEMEQIMEGLSKDKKALKSETAVVGAFIIFEYPESRQRCLDDYHWSNYRHWFRYPKCLKLRGHRLHIHPAPDPEDVLWENLHVTPFLRFLRRMVVNVVMLIFLIISFTVIISLATTKQKRLSSIPKLGMCATEVPALFLGNYSTTTTGLTFVRPGVFHRPANDLTCSNTYNMEAYAVYSYHNDYNQPATTYDFTTCSSPCPAPTKATQCPCIDATGRTECQTLSCFAGYSDNDHKVCKTFESSTIAGCYCYNQLNSGEGNWFSRLSSLTQDDVCSSLAASFSAVQALQVILSVSTLVLNFALQVVTMRLSKFEHNDSSDVEASQLITKIFVSQYVNTALILLLVYGKSSSTDAITKLFQKFNIFNGSYDDFSPTWFGVVGTQLITTALIATFTPHVVPLLQHFILLPSRRRVAATAMAQGRPLYAMQQDLNDLYVGPRFDVTMRYSQILNVIFFSMTFSAGMPFLLVLALLNFILSYQFDRFLLLRFYSRPPQRNERLQKGVNAALPYAVFIHLGFAVWMFGSDSVFGAYMVNSYLATSLREQTPDTMAVTNVVWRIARNNVFPLFFFWLLLLLYLVLADVIPTAYITDFLQWLWTFCHKVVVANPTAAYNMFTDNGFTKVFERPIPSDFGKSKVTSPGGGGKYDDWDVYTYDDGSSVLRKLRSPGKYSPTVASTRVGNPMSPAANKSLCRKTWEVIKVNALHSYALIRNPKYRDAVLIFMKEFASGSAKLLDKRQDSAEEGRDTDARDTDERDTDERETDV